MNSCIDCRYSEDAEYRSLAKCHCPDIEVGRDMVTGDLYCKDARQIELSCGRKGNYFKRKNLIQIPCKIPLDGFIAILMIAFVLMLIFVSTVNAKDITITSTGYGNTQDQALLDSFYHAVQNANGVHVSSVLELRNGNLTKEEIITQSKGFIKGYSILVPYDGSSITTKIIFGDEKQQVPLEQRVKNTFTIGSSYDEVKKAHGIPNEVMNLGTRITWRYTDRGEVTFDSSNEQVIEYRYWGNGLNIR